MQLETLGHASLLISDDAGRPVLLTDPWLVGSVYWRSWWLQHYPDDATLERLRDCAYVYVTHEHPDHYHPPTLRRLGTGPTVFVPALTETEMALHLRENGYTVECLEADRWRTLSDELRILSVPLWNDDSALVLETPKAVVFNLNDAKPHGQLYRQLRALCAPGKKVVVLSSHSPASIVNSFERDGERVSLLSSADYVKHAVSACEKLGADYFIPFASQAVFHRADSRWANDYRVSFEELRAGWSGRARLLPPYSRLDLESFEHSFVPPEDWRSEEPYWTRRVAEREAAEADASFGAEDVARLARKLGGIRVLLALVFPFGIDFLVGGRRLHYAPIAGRLAAASGARPHFTVEVPALPLEEVLEYGRVSDLGIGMFVTLHLERTRDPRWVYLFFAMLGMHDYGHLAGPGAFFRWAGFLLRTLAPRRLAGATAR